MTPLLLTLVLGALAALAARNFLPRTRRRSVAATVGWGVVAGVLGAVVFGAVLDRGDGIEDAILFYAVASGTLATWLLGVRDSRPGRP